MKSVRIDQDSIKINLFSQSASNDRINIMIRSS